MNNNLLSLNLFIYAFAILLSAAKAQAKNDTVAAWKFQTGGPVYSSPTCDNGLVYIGSDDGKMYCLYGESGTVKWVFGTGGLIRCKPAVTGALVYFESEDGYVYALNKNSGRMIWKTDIGNTLNKRVLPNLAGTTGNSWDYMQSSPCIDNGVVYVGSGDSSLHAVNSQTGVVLWKVQTGNVIRSSPCVLGGSVYVGSWDGYIYAFNKTDGSIVWKYNAGRRVQESPRINDGILFCGSRGGNFYALDAVRGMLIWKYYYGPKAPFVESSAAIENGKVYVGSSDLFTVFAFDAATGNIIWCGPVPGDTWSSPFLKGGTLYIGLASYDHHSMTAQVGGALLAINAFTGRIKWRYNTGTSTFIGGVVSSPTVDKNLIYFGGLDGYVYAVDTACARS
jgi:eukaryotic-like serine/threonine-protein kinase